MGHIELSRDRDIIVVAPATSDFLAKLANGLADDLLSTLCLARRSPLMVAPAMNVEMWQNAATQRNAELLRADGVVILAQRRATMQTAKAAWDECSNLRDIRRGRGCARPQDAFQKKSPNHGGTDL